MGVIKDLADLAEKAINEHGSAPILKERLGLLSDKAQAFEKENVELKKRVAELEDLTGRLTRELQAKTIPEDLVEHRGVFFRRKAGGGYYETVHCHLCRSPMASLLDEIPFKCNKPGCGYKANFAGKQLASIMADLPS